MNTFEPFGPEDAHPDPRDLLPHHGSAVLIERIIEASDDHMVCRALPGVVDAERTEDGMIPAVMSVEYMAQAIAVFAGLRAEPTRRKDIGYIIAARDLELAVPGFPAGEAITVRVIWQWGNDRLGRFRTSIECNGRELASALMSVYRPSPEEQP